MGMGARAHDGTGGMTAQVIHLPVVAKRLEHDQRVEEKRQELEDAERWVGWLYDGVKLAEERFPELAGAYGGQDLAVEWADQIAADLRKELAGLETQVPA